MNTYLVAVLTMILMSFGQVLLKLLAVRVAAAGINLANCGSVLVSLRPTWWCWVAGSTCSSRLISTARSRLWLSHSYSYRCFHILFSTKKLPSAWSQAPP